MVEFEEVNDLPPFLKKRHVRSSGAFSHVAAGPYLRKSQTAVDFQAKALVVRSLSDCDPKRVS